MILSHIVEMRFKDGMKVIRSQFEHMQMSPCSRVWASEFLHNANNFASSKICFEESNLKSLFQHEYETKECFYTCLLSEKINNKL